MIKRVLRYTMLFSFAIVTGNLFLANINYSSQINTLLLASAALALLEIFIKPILRILLLPINLLTLGLIGLIVNTFCLYLITFFVDNFSINNFVFYGYPLNGFFAYLASSFILGFIFNFFKFLIKK